MKKSRSFYGASNVNRWLLERGKDYIYECHTCSGIYVELWGCPSGSFDILVACENTGQFCDDEEATDGCLNCDHCDGNDRSQGKCPECSKLHKFFFVCLG